MSPLPHRASQVLAVALTTVAVGVSALASTSSAQQYWESRSRTLAATSISPAAFEAGSTAPRQWENRLTSNGGVWVKVESTRDATWTVELSPSGDGRVVTNNPYSPEWLFVGESVFARLGMNEREANQATLTAVGKPEARWTNAARGAGESRQILRSLDIGAGISEMNAIATPAVENAEGLQWNVDCSRWKTSRWAFWEPFGDECSIRIDLDTSGTPTAITSADSMHTMTWTVEVWESVEVQAPTPPQVVTLRDLAAAASTPVNPAEVRDAGALVPETAAATE